MKQNAAAQKLDSLEVVRPRTVSNVTVLTESLMKRPYTSWSEMSTDQLVEEGNRQIRERGIPSKSKLKDMASGLFRAIKRRENADEIWKRMEFCEKKTGQTAACKKHEKEISETPLIEEPVSGIRASETQFGLPEEEAPALPTQKYGGWKTKASDTIIRIANDYIQKAGIGSLKELKAADKSLWAVIKKRKIWRMLEFVEKEKTAEPKPEKKQESSAPKEKETPDSERMFRYILQECFRMGSGKAYIGCHRVTIQQTRSGARFTKPEWKAFKRCWRMLSGAGIITYNSTETAASLDIKRNHIEDPVIKRVVQEAIEEESKVKT
ncbi:hypothetical protein JXA56_03540, partial [Candidatus Micrarchaeota archaeon]|nr:hypothetical protein [Candidatus Micrarchaeota archaeon]